MTTAFAKTTMLGGVNAQSTTYSLLASDQGKVISCTSTFTLTLLAAATAGSQFTVLIVNTGAGVITVDGAGAETINGETSIALGPLGSMLITTDSSNWYGTHTEAPPLLTTSGTWTPTLEDTSFSASEGQGYTLRGGTYTRVGDMVFVTGYLQMSSTGTLTSGDAAYIGGLPFDVDTTIGYEGGISFGQSTGLNVTAGTSISGYGASNSTDGYMRLQTQDETTGSADMTISEVGSTAILIFHGQYVTNE